MPAVLVGLSGGLGNQMFQYAAARALALSRGAPLLLDLTPLLSDALRSYALDSFNTKARIAATDELPSPPGPLAKRLRWKARSWGGTGYILERSFMFDARVLAASLPVYLSGNFQSEAYFEDQREQIRREFSLRAPMSAERSAFATEIVDCNAVSIHVRRGDYASNAAANAYHGTVEPEWYAQAMAEIEKRAGPATYFVFSDDIDWALANLPATAEMTFVPAAADGRDYEDLHLMAQCRHHIIANSSFSWWGAWLNPRPDKVVIAPKRWFSGAKHDTRDLIPEPWIWL